VYATTGITQYLIVNWQPRQLFVFRRPTAKGYQSEEILTQGEINPVACPDVAVAIARLFGELNA
jgi:Uma2 family endonuclease